MPGIEIVLVEPLHEGNVGAVARVMKNFGFSRLVLVDPCPIGDDAIARAAHARDVLESAERCSLKEVLSRSSLSVATTGEVSMSVCRSVRMPYFTPRELRPHIEDIEGTISFLFGRENFGLSNEEIAESDIICTIPTSAAYPILNISHAVAIVCYECAYLQKGAYLLASREEMDHLYRHLDLFLDEIEHPAHKRKNTILLLRRILGRARLTAREASTLHGLLRRTEWHIGAAGGIRSAQIDTRGNDDLTDKD
ncbi:MAG: RNA methyltransferase [Methanoregulaceae archaeon]|nr:RNA methyltransferase [Methanoregulaceae archaeon]